ncbi:MAG TPA: MBL fold metallo-hydrolase [Acidimicrobiales bacterium]|nr:MBL fold metallo-hydrolase [Acidimicrobiales bacterium]
MSLTLTVLGCDGSHAGPGGAASGYLVRSWDSGTSIWMDAGPGTFANLQRFCDPARLSAVVLSHEHPDHWSDIDGFVTASRWTAELPPAPIPVFAASGVYGRFGDEATDVFAWREVGDGDGADVGDLRLRFSGTDHMVPTLAVRIDGPSGVLGYSADSGPGWSFEALGSGIDLALCEATFTKRYEGSPGHMSGRQAGEAARHGGARRLVVTHRWAKESAAEVEAEAAQSFGGPVASAAVGHGYSL